MKLLFVASLSSCVVLLLQTPVTPLQQQRPRGGIEGTVTRLGSGQPVLNARVTVSVRQGQPGPRGGPPPAPIPPVMTDDKGKFAVTGLDDGVYNVQFLANGYVAQPFGQRFPNGPGSPVTVSGGQATKDVSVALMPAASISGQVRDTSDQPLINVPVELLRSYYDSFGRRTYEPAGLAHTNDRGEYRMYWVAPGRYYLIAGRPEAPSDDGYGPSGTALPRVIGYSFYPGATEIKTAREIDLQPGADLRTIDVAVTTRSRTFAIRGKIIDSRTGKAPARAKVLAEPQSPGLKFGYAETNLVSQNYQEATGTFEIRKLLPGTYSIMAKVLARPIPGVFAPPNAEASGVIPVTITDSDVNGVTLSVVPGATINGRLRIDGELPAGLAVNDPRVTLIPVEPGNGFPQMREGLLGVDRSFRITNVAPVEYWLDLDGIPVIGFLKEARLNGVDVLSAPLRISGSDNAQLDIVLRIGGGQVTGRVTDVRSQPVPSARVVIVPDRARFRTNLYRTASTDQDGRFTLSRLAPGDYKVFSWESLENNAWLDPDVIGRSEQRGRSVHVTESSTEAITLQVIPAEGPRP